MERVLGDFRAPDLRVLRSVWFNQELACYLKRLELSGQGIVDWIMHQLLDVHVGKLTGPDGEQIRLHTDDVGEVARYDRLFSEDEKRFINRYLQRAEGGFKNCLQDRMVHAVAMMDLARQIHLARD